MLYAMVSTSLLSVASICQSLGGDPRSFCPEKPDEFCLLQHFCRYPFDPRDGEPVDNRSIVQKIIAGQTSLF